MTSIMRTRTPDPRTAARGPADRTWLGRLAHVIRRYRWVVIGAWIVLTLFGGFAAGQLSSRW
jgi:hypothetical protein